MIEINCPWCGPRVSGEFTCLGEHATRPGTGAGTIEAWRSYLYDHVNLPSWTEEQWWHGAGCGATLTLERHLASNEIRYDRPSPTSTQHDEESA